MDILDEVPMGARKSTEAWLSDKSLATVRNYAANIRELLAYCRKHDLDVLNLTQEDADLFGGYLRTKKDARTTIARKIAALSSWMAYLADRGVVKANAFAHTPRPKIDRHYSSTRFLSVEEATLLLRAAETVRGVQRLRNAALVRLMLTMGIRVGEAVRLRMEDLEIRDGMHTLRVEGKGGKRVQRALPTPVFEALYIYLEAHPHEGYLFVTGSGRRLDEAAVFRLIQGFAHAAGLEQPHTVTPHVTRHTFATGAAVLGADLSQIQDAMGHADPRTTRKYARAADALLNDPAHKLAEALG